MLNYGERLEHMRAKQLVLVACLYLNHMTISNRPKVFLLQHVTKFFTLQIKEQILHGNHNFFLIEINQVGNIRWRDHETVE